MNRRIFETYVEKELAPALEKGDVVIMDNLPARKAAAKAIKARGAWILFLPPYSPDLKPPLATPPQSLGKRLLRH